MNENLKQYDFDRIIIAVTIMTYNIAHLDKIWWWFEENKQDNWEIYFNNVVAKPPYLNPRILPNEILDKIDFRFPKITYEQDAELGKHLDLFVNYTKDLDKIRDTNVLDYCPELKDLFV